MTQLKVYLSESFHPHLNLATEEWIFNSVDPSSQILFIWRNEETVVIGRNQNPWSECNLTKMKEDGVHLARRTTGGGAVFHDRGNTNFTFLSPKDGYRRENNIEIILKALQSFGISGEASGRNDLLIPFPDGPRKFSGSAYREKKDRAFHHGTLLLHADLNRLGMYLTPNPKKLQAKGKESVRARVANLNEVVPTLSHEDILGAMIESFENFYGEKASIESLNLESLQQIPELKKQYEELGSWDWLYGRTLEFTQQMDHYMALGFFDFHFQVVESVVRDLQIYTDCLYPLLIDDLTEALRGQYFQGDKITAALLPVQAKYPHLTAELNELSTWLSHQVEI